MENKSDHKKDFNPKPLNKKTYADLPIKELEERLAIEELEDRLEMGCWANACGVNCK